MTILTGTADIARRQRRAYDLLLQLDEANGIDWAALQPETAEEGQALVAEARAIRGRRGGRRANAGRPAITPT